MINATKNNRIGVFCPRQKGSSTILLVRSFNFITKKNKAKWPKKSGYKIQYYIFFLINPEKSNETCHFKPELDHSPLS